MERPNLRFIDIDPALLKSLIVTHPAVDQQLRNRIRSFPPRFFPPAAQQVHNTIVQATGQAPTVTTEGTAAVAPLIAALVASQSAWESEGKMNPGSSLRRWRQNPTRFLGGTVTLSSAGAGQVVFQPQEDFDGFRLCVPSGQAALPAQVSNFTVGDQEIFTEANNLGAELLAETSDFGRVDLPHMKVGMNAYLSIVSGVASKEFAAVIMGYAASQRSELPEGAELLYTRMEPMGQVSVAAGGTATFNLQPQRHVIGRRLMFGFGGTQTGLLSSLYVTGITVQNKPQLEGGIEIPLELFQVLAIDDWIDMNLCQLGGKISVTLRNADTVNAIAVDGGLTVDVVRLAGEPAY